jgi:calpain
MLDKNTVLACSMGVFPPIFHKFRTKDIYVLRFYKDYKWRYVVIDKKLPVVDYQLCFATCTDEEELWVPLIEKAYAKLFGCYEALRSGNIDEGLVDMTGFACEKKTLHDKAKNFVPNKEEFWQLLMEMYRRGCLMGCSRSGGTEHALQIEGQDTGILTGHAYGLNAVFEFFDENMPNARKSHRLVLIRNPWGNTEWQLKWGSGSEELETHEKAV